MAEKTIVIDVEISQDDVAAKLSKTKAELAKLRSEQRQLNEFIKNGADVNGQLSKTYAENAARIKELTATEKTYTAQLTAATVGSREYGDSVFQLQAKLAELKSVYRGLTEEQRKSAEGESLKNSISELDEEVKGINFSLGDFQSNVGNYASALTGLNSNVVKVAGVFSGGFKNGLAVAGNALKSFGKALIATPVGWILAAIAAIVAIFGKLKEAFARNDSAATTLSAALAKFQPILTAIRKGFDLLATGVAKVVDGFMSVASSVVGFLVPSFNEASDAAAELVVAEDNLEEAQRNYTVESAKRQKEIAELNKKARGDASLTAQERERIYQQADELERKDLEQRKEIAAENLRIMEAKYRQEVDTSDEAADNIAAARAELYRAETEYFEGTTRLASRQAAAQKEIAADLKRQHDEWVARVKGQNALIKETERNLEDLRISFIRDEVERQRAEIRKNYQRQIEDLKQQLKEGENLTKKSRANLNEQIVLLARKMNDELAKINEDALKAQSDKEIEEFTKLNDMRAAMFSERLQVGYSYSKEISALKRRLDEERDLTVAARQAINEQILILESQKDEEMAQKAREEVRKRVEDEAREREIALRGLIAKAQGSESELARLQIEQAIADNRRLVEIDDETKAALFDNEKAYETAVLESEENIRLAREANNELLKKQAEETANTMRGVTAAMSELFGAVAGDTEEYEAFRKAMAIVDATISLAETIAKATAISTEGDPYTMAIRIATNVAAVVSQFAALIASIKSVTIPSAPTFAEGGIVPGSRFYGDTVSARLNSGEMVISREDQRRLWEMVKGGVPGDNVAAMREAFVQALREMPAPILDYSEFTRFQRNVKMVERKTKLR